MGGLCSSGGNDNSLSFTKKKHVSKHQQVKDHHYSVGSIIVVTDKGMAAMHKCTASYIRDGWILTAGHCFREVKWHKATKGPGPEIELIDPKYTLYFCAGIIELPTMVMFGFSFEQFKSIDGAECAQINDVYIGITHAANLGQTIKSARSGKDQNYNGMDKNDPGYSKIVELKLAFSAWDIALAKLNKKIKKVPYPIDVAQQNGEREYAIVGYPASKADDLRLYAWTITGHMVQNQKTQANRDTWLLKGLITERGVSGGPDLEIIDTTPTVIGVHVAGIKKDPKEESIAMEVLFTEARVAAINDLISKVEQGKYDQISKPASGYFIPIESAHKQNVHIFDGYHDDHYSKWDSYEYVDDGYNDYNNNNNHNNHNINDPLLLGLTFMMFILVCFVAACGGNLIGWVCGYTLRVGQERLKDDKRKDLDTI